MKIILYLLIAIAMSCMIDYYGTTQPTKVNAYDRPAADINPSTVIGEVEARSAIVIAICIYKPYSQVVSETASPEHEGCTRGAMLANKFVN